ncbi:MAG TPA: hypothetical protein VH186_00450 [Chloroflexia bacterium]|nr:hypothetical protein [Chloroflexia bacterium]
MSTTYNSLADLNSRIEQLKKHQQSCTQFLLECISVRQEHPEFAERLDSVIAKVENTMSQNAIVLARLETEARNASMPQLAYR